LGGAAAVGGHMVGMTGGLKAQLLAMQSISTQIGHKIQELVQTNQMSDRVSTSKDFTLVHAAKHQENCCATRSQEFQGDIGGWQ
jgi:hypothetical protein